MAAGQGSIPSLQATSKKRKVDELGPMSEDLGRVAGPERTRISARLKAAKEAAAAIAADAAAETTDDKTLDKIVAEIQNAQGEPLVGGRKSKRGGGREENIQYLKTLAQSFITYASTELEPIGGPVMSLARGTVGLTQEVVVRVPVTIAALTISTTALSANFFKSLFAKFNAWGRTTATTLSSELTAEQAADAAVADLPSIARTATVGVVFFNQLGLLPLSAVIAAILYAVRLNVATGPGRSLLISQFYAWYVMRSKSEQAKIIKDAKEYASAAAKAGGAALATTSPAVIELAKSLSDFVSKVGSSTTSSSSAAAAQQTLPSADTILTTGSKAAAVVGSAMEETNDTVNESKAAKRGEADVTAVVKTASEAANRYSFRRRTPTSPGSSSANSQSSMASIEGSEATISPGAIKRAKGNKALGGRKTYRKKSKRRVTRRKAVMPTFVY